MITVSEAFKTELKSPATRSSGKLLVYNEDSSFTIELTSDMFSKFELNVDAFNEDKIFGNIATTTLSVEILGDYTSLIPRNTIIYVTPYIGVYNDTLEDYEYVEYQRFIINEIKYDDTSKITKLMCADELIKLNAPFNDVSVYPITLKEYAEDVLSQCGLELENTTFFYDSYEISELKIQSGTSCREIIKQIASLSLSFVTIDIATGKVKFNDAFKSLLIADETIEKSTYYELKLTENNFGNNGVNTLVLNVSQVEGENNSKENEANVLIDGAIEVVISDNAFINTETLRLAEIDNLFTYVDGYMFEPFSLNYRGFPYLELNDVVSITMMDDSIITVPIFGYSIRYDGGLYGTLFAEGVSDSETKYKYTSEMQTRLRNAEIKVDKVEGTISSSVEALNTKIDGEVEKLNADIVLSADGVLQTISNTYTTTADFITETEKITNTVDSNALETKTTFTEVKDSVTDVDGKVETKFTTLETYIRTSIEGIELGDINSEFKLKITNHKISFLQNDSEVAHISNSTLNITDGTFFRTLKIGDPDEGNVFGFTPRTNGSLSFGRIK